MDKNKEKLLSLIEDVTWGFFQVVEGYTGRGMLGRKSLLAFTSGVFPHSDRGRRLTRELFLTWDAPLFKEGEWVYYYSGTQLPDAEEIKKKMEEESGNP